MNKLLSKNWFPVVAGAIIYLISTVLFWQKPQMPAKQVAAEIFPTVGPSWEYNNPEADQLITELKAEKKSVEQRAQQLDDLEKRLNTERGELANVIQTVRQLQTNFDKSVLRIKDDEAVNLKKLAKVYSNMTPEGAASVMEQLDNEAIVKILLFLKDDETAAILESLSKRNEVAARRTAQISEQIRLAAHNPAPK
jgi:flagellar motility protein MotE (MotC chaperone)